MSSRTFHNHRRRLAIGSRAQVFNGSADHTSGGLTKRNLFINKHGRIVSLAKHRSAKREKRLVKHGYGAQKGKFGYVKIDSTRRRRRH